MSILNASALSAVLKQKYTQRRFNLLCYKDNPFWAMVPKRTDFGGANKVVACRISTPQGRGLSIAQAQAGKTPSTYDRFTITRHSDYVTASISTEAIWASEGDENSLIEGLSKEIDGATHTLVRSLAIALFRNGGGARGQISSSSTPASSATITLANIADITQFEVGMILVTSSDDGTGGAGVRTGNVTLTGVDRDLGKLTVSGANWAAGISAVAAGDYIFMGNASGTDYNGMVNGLGAWIPLNAPGGSDSFNGLNRSADVTRLAGVRYVGGGGPYEQSLIGAAARLCREGSNPDVCFMNPLDYASLVVDLGTKVIYDRVQSVDMPDVGFKAVQVDGPKGPIKCVADLNCPQGTAFMLQMDTWSFDSLKSAPKLIDVDGLTIYRNPTSDDYEARVVYMGDLTCEAPGWNARITW